MEIGAGAMFDASDLSDELLGLKGEVSHLLNTKGEGLFEASRDRTAAFLGALNFVLAAILFVIGARPPSGRELELAAEIHGSSVDALQLEARALQAELSGMIHHPLNGILPLMIVPLITIIVRSLKKS